MLPIHYRQTYGSKFVQHIEAGRSSYGACIPDPESITKWRIQFNLLISDGYLASLGFSASVAKWRSLISNMTMDMRRLARLIEA
jgi:hypothetical protein